ncbi:non-ribosomal peptide synthetase [Kroppenstedtia eburnea]|uniref:non-ribosomal peptide synthetase n=1 Tax=Kroppenstedtia eburnea TaxID=714067 RepID=UPI0013563F4B|nr:non-ribosomal peptide synthetase [Kroppenstedtia eburnea]QKI81708.1 amino acid adenylation domain-containing protein [Kroppenstedtia eburnea]
MQLLFHCKDHQNRMNTKKWDRYDLFMVCCFEKKVADVSFRYNGQLFDHATIDRMLMNFQVLLQGALSTPEMAIARLPLLEEAERQKLLLEWNNAEVELPQELIHEKFAAIACQMPDQTAVEADGVTWTYRELNDRSERLANFLRREGVGPDVLVGICMERSVEMLIGLFGILKAGGAYVPLDPANPQERLSFLLADSGVSVLLTQEKWLSDLPRYEGRVICLDRDWPRIASCADAPPPSRVHADNLAYMIYTSGSTGTPKGVLIPHHGLSNYLAWALDAYGVEQGIGSIVSTSLAFDATITSLFLPLLTGRRVILLRDGEEVEQLSQQLRKHQNLSLLKITPAHLPLLNQQLSPEELAGRVRTVVIGGAALRGEDIAFWQQADPETRFINEYGPTETVVGCSVYEAKEMGGAVPIGRPIANMKLYVLDDWMQPVPIGVPGELYIGGVALARGYHNRPELTAERFVPNPFSDEPGSRLYKTGDRARYLSDGNLEYLGRVDDQVKLRGYRIEPGEIQGVLLQHPAVAEAIVILREDTPGDQRLVAYVTVSEGHEWNLRDVKQHLVELLPSYMVPSAYVALDEIPLTLNGKVDHRALPAPDPTYMKRKDDDLTLPRTPVEEKLAAIFEDLLHVESVDIHDSFFEIGGHSLLATQLISRVYDEFQVKLPIQSLFQLKSVEKLSRRIEQAWMDENEAEGFLLRRIPRDGNLRLSFAQHRMWFLHRLNPESTAYHIPTVIHLEGSLDTEALLHSIREIVNRQESFRTRFYEVEGEPVQEIREQTEFEVPLIQLKQADRDQVRLLMKKLVDEPFDLSEGPLFRGALVQTGEHEHYLIWVVHHIISDGWSEELFRKELAIWYRAFLTGESSPLPELPIQYADYAHWQQEWMKGSVIRQQLQYWTQQLSGTPPLLQMPTDRPRPAVQSFRGATHRFAIAKGLYEQIKQLSHEADMTLFMTLFASFNTWLHRYSGQEDLWVGSAIANRNRTEIEELMGFFVNTLVLRTDFSDNPTFQELLKQVRDVALQAYENQDVPFERLVEELQPERDLSYSPLFQVMFVMQNTPVQEVDAPGLKIRRTEFDSETAKFDLTMFVTEMEEELLVSLEYNADLFDAATIERMASHFGCLLHSIVANPQQRVGELPLLTWEEREWMLSEWNDTEVELPQELIHEKFAAIARQMPDQTAVEADGVTWTYRELNDRSERLANFLRREGVGPDVLVGICMERSVEMLIGLFGILKAGGAYVPLDPANPQERLSFLLADSGVSVLLTQEKWLSYLPQYEGRVVCLNRDWPRIDSCADAPPSSRVHADNLAYMIYTSGSTGTPKGVIIPHRGLTNYLAWALDAYGVEQGIGSIVSTSLAFDATITSLFLPLLTGRRVILLRDGEEVEQLSQLLRKHRPSLLKITPAHLPLLKQQLSPQELAGRVGTVVIGGAALRGEDIAFWQQADPETRFINEYGPTETVVGCGIYEAKEMGEGPVPIGRPIANMKLYVLDDWMQPVPIGVPGELYIGGVALARGYHNRPELTAERFVPNPFSDETGSRLYKTGDRARYLSDGNLEYLGRVDDQVKLRGYRIEPGEIQGVLLQHPAVAEAIVILREDSPGDQRLVAYVTVSEGHEWNLRDVKQHLAELLPSYMVPSAIVVLDALPLTLNGKVNRQLLPPPSHDPREGGDMAPRTPTEERLATIFADVLSVEQVGVHDHFFERGGHSLLVIQVLSRIRSTWNIELSVGALFEAPSVAELAEQVDRAVSESTQRVSLASVERTETMPVSFAQQRLWFLEQLEGESALYNVPLPLHIEGNLNEQALTSAIREIVRRHEVLRTTFTEVEGNVVQVIASAPSELQIPVIDLSEEGVEFRSMQVQRLIGQLAEQTFNLTQGPLFRSHLLKLKKDEHVLVLTLHHIVTDGWSNDVLIQELGQLYKAFVKGQPLPLPELPVQYADYATWQRQWLQGDRLDRQLKYWTHRLADAPSPLALQTDYPRPPVLSYRGAVRFFELPTGVSAALKKLSSHAGVTLFMTLLAAYKTLLFRESGEEDLVIGFPVANRNRSEIEGLIGFFVNTLVLRTDLSGNPTFQELLQQVKEVALEAYANQDVPFEKLVEELQPERNRSYSPLCQVVFAFQQERPTSIFCQDVTMTFCEVELKSSKFDLTFFMEERGEQLVGSVEYSTDLFAEKTIERMIEQYRAILESVVEDPQQRLREIQLRSDAGLVEEELDELFK